jgi:hypothetical protein
MRPCGNPCGFSTNPLGASPSCVAKFLISKETLTVSSKTKAQPTWSVVITDLTGIESGHQQESSSAMNVEGGDETYRHFDIIMFVDDSYLIRFPEDKDTSKYEVCKKSKLVKHSISQEFKVKTRKLQHI